MFKLAKCKTNLHSPTPPPKNKKGKTKELKKKLVVSNHDFLHPLSWTCKLFIYYCTSLECTF